MSFREPAYPIRIGSRRTSEKMSRVRLTNWPPCQKLEQTSVEEVLIAGRRTWFAAPATWRQLVSWRRMEQSQLSGEERREASSGREAGSPQYRRMGMRTGGSDGGACGTRVHPIAREFPSCRGHGVASQLVCPSPPFS